MIGRRLPPAPSGTRWPRQVTEIAWLHVASKALATAVELKLFDAVGAGATVVQAAARAGVSERGARMLLDALAALGLVRKEAGRYLLSAEAEATLRTDRAGWVGEHVLRLDRGRAAWDALPAVVRSGRPAMQVDDEATARTFFPDVARALYAPSLPVARRTAEKLAGLRPAPKLVLDVGAGSGVWGIAIAERFPAALVTALDFAEVLSVTREHVVRHGLEARFAYLAASLREVDLGDQAWDLVVLGQILHSEGAARSRALLDRVARALRPGGACLVVETIPDEARRERLLPLLFGLNMLLRTSDGDVFTLPELRAWLVAAGLRRVIPFDAGGLSPIVLALKPRAPGRPRRQAERR